MKALQHTCGPWTDPDADGFIYADTEEMPQICQVCPIDDLGDGVVYGSKSVGNAALIVAAPDMLDALKHAEKLLERYGMASGTVGAAIAKAEGRS